MFPFFTAEQFTQAGYQLPQKDKTAKALQPLSFLSEPQPKALEDYCLFYGLNHLPATHTQGYLNAADYRIHVQMFTPNIPTCKGTVWVLHGYLEHSAIYQPLYNEIISQGYAVLVYDLPGHGLSSGREASIHHFSEYQIVLEAIHQWVLNHAIEYIPQPWLGIGQSTGGAIWMDHALNAFIKQQDSTQVKSSSLKSNILEPIVSRPIVSKLLLLSPLVRPAQSILIKNPLSHFILKQFNGNLQRKFRLNNSNIPFLTFVRQEDPLQPRVMAMPWVIAVLQWQAYMSTLPACNYTVWVAQGEQDQTVDWRYNMQFVKQKFYVERLLMMSSCSHQLVNERADLRAPLSKMIEAFLAE